MKRFLSVLLSLALIVSLSACSSADVLTITLKHKVSSKVDDQIVKDANRYAMILKDNIAAAEDEYDSEVGFIQYTFNHSEMVRISDEIKNAEGVSEASNFRYDLINIAYIMSTINYCYYNYAGDELYDETLKLLAIDGEGLTSKLEKSQAISDYAKKESESFLKTYYRKTIDPDALIEAFKNTGRSEAESASS